MQNKSSIRALRVEMGLNQAQFGKKIGLAHKSQVCEIEKGKRNVPLKVALKIEKLSKGRINASDLNDDVRASREFCHDYCLDDDLASGDAAAHDGGDSDDPLHASMGQSPSMSDEGEYL